MPFPITTQGLLGIFPQGADLPANDPHATTPPIRSPTSSSLQAILAAGAGDRRARGGASGRRGPQEEGRSGKGWGGEIEGWSGRSDDESDAETAEEG